MDTKWQIVFRQCFAPCSQEQKNMVESKALDVDL